MAFSFQHCTSYLISLENRVDRREAFIQNIQAHQFNEDEFNWLVAIRDANFGGLGCAKSHLLALSEFICKTDAPYCCILEDDFRFRISKHEVEHLVNLIDQDYSWDVFMLGGTQTVGIPTMLRSSQHKIEKLFEANTSSGYICKRSYAQKLIVNMLDCIQGMEKFRHLEPRSLVYHSFALDQVWKGLQRIDNWYCSNPMAGYQVEGYSDIEQKDVNYLACSQ
jgi:GR25 family glycosyltransferase involved in LPS biosynthesis